MENYNINNCYNIDSDAIRKLKERIISYFDKLLCLTEKGHKPNYEFILEIISLIDLYEHKLVDRDKLLFVIQYYLNKIRNNEKGLGVSNVEWDNEVLN